MKGKIMGRKPKVKTKEADKNVVEEATEGLGGDPLADIDFSSIAPLELGEVSPTVSLEDLEVPEMPKVTSKKNGTITGRTNKNPDTVDFSAPLMAELKEIKATVDSIAKSEQFTTQKLARDMHKKFDISFEQLTNQLSELIKSSVGNISRLEAKMDEVMQVRTITVAGKNTVEEEEEEEEEEKPKAKRGRPKKTEEPDKEEVVPIPDNVKTYIIQFVEAQKAATWTNDNTLDICKKLAGAAKITPEQVYTLLVAESKINNGMLTTG